MSFFINTAGILILVLFYGCLLLGLVLCRKYGFKAGFYFFLIQIAHKISIYFLGPYLNSFILTYVENSRSLPMGVTLGEAAAGLKLIDIAIEIVAFGILIAGLYKMWRFNTIQAPATANQKDPNY